MRDEGAEERQLAHDFRRRQYGDERHVALRAQASGEGDAAAAEQEGEDPHMASLLRREANTARAVVHVDVDCFYAQAEEVRDPALRSKPLGITQKHIIVTSNYHARAAGVRKLQSIRDATEACPGLVLVSGEDLTPYRRASKQIVAVLERFGEAEKLGLDEVFVDVTEQAQHLIRSLGPEHLTPCGHVHFASQRVKSDNPHRPMDLQAKQLASAAQETAAGALPPLLAAASMVAAQMRRTVLEATGFRCSAGIANNKLLAKLVSGLHKPNDQTILPFSQAAAFVAPLPVRALQGVGTKTERALRERGVELVRHVRRLGRAPLAQLLGARVGELLFLACRGLDDAPVKARGPPRSITCEDSFRGCSSWEAVQRVLRVLAPDLAARVHEDALEFARRPRTLTVKWRHHGSVEGRHSASGPLPVLSHSHSHSQQQQQEQEAALVAGALALLRRHLRPPFNLSLINLGVTNFLDTQQQQQPPQPSASACLMSRFLARPAPSVGEEVVPTAAAGPSSSGDGAAAMDRDPAGCAAAAERMRKNYELAVRNGHVHGMSKAQERRLREGGLRHDLMAEARPGLPPAAAAPDDAAQDGQDPPAEVSAAFWEDLQTAGAECEAPSDEPLDPRPAAREGHRAGTCEGDADVGQEGNGGFDIEGIDVGEQRRILAAIKQEQRRRASPSRSRPSPAHSRAPKRRRNAASASSPASKQGIRRFFQPTNEQSSEPP